MEAAEEAIRELQSWTRAVPGWNRRLPVAPDGWAYFQVGPLWAGMPVSWHAAARAGLCVGDTYDLAALVAQRRGVEVVRNG